MCNETGITKQRLNFRELKGHNIMRRPEGDERKVDKCCGQIGPALRNISV